MFFPIENISDAGSVRIAVDFLYSPGKNPGMTPENGNFSAFL